MDVTLNSNNVELAKWLHTASFDQDQQLDDGTRYAMRNASSRLRLVLLVFSVSVINSDSVFPDTVDRGNIFVLGKSNPQKIQYLECGVAKQVDLLLEVLYIIGLSYFERRLSAVNQREH